MPWLLGGQQFFAPFLSDLIVVRPFREMSLVSHPARASELSMLRL
jgi:hypothetical protein